MHLTHRNCLYVKKPSHAAIKQLSGADTRWNAQVLVAWDKNSLRKLSEVRRDRPITRNKDASSNPLTLTHDDGLR